MPDLADLLERAAALRHAFDSSFAEPVSVRADDLVEILLLTVQGRQHGVHLDEVRAVVADRPITPVPSPSAALLGLAGFRGAVVSIYDLALLLGSPAAERPRWMILSSADPSIGFALQRFDGHVRVAREAIASSGSGPAQVALDVLRLGQRTVPIISVADILSTIRSTEPQNQPHSTDRSPSS